MAIKSIEVGVVDGSSVQRMSEGEKVEGGPNPKDERKLLWRIDLGLLPLMAGSILLQYLDKQTLNSASIMGIIQDLNLEGREYSWTSSIFYFGFFAFTYVASFLMVRLPIGRFLASTFLIWAVCVGHHAATTNYAGLMVVRFFLGAAGASITPGFSLITGMWYRRQEQPLRHGIWFVGTSVGIMFGGLLAYAIAHIQGGIGPWKWSFIIFALITIAWAIILLWFLLDTPGNARFLSKELRDIAISRVRTNQTGIKNNEFKWYQVREALLDIKDWLVVLFICCVSVCNGALGTFSSLVIQGFGFDIFETCLFNLAIGAVHAVFGIVATWICGQYKDVRCMVAATFLVGSMLVRFGPNQGSKVFGFLIFFAYPTTIAIGLSMISSNVTEFTNKSVASSMLTVFYCVGNIIGPFLFIPDEAPTYPSGFIGTTTCFGIALLLIAALRLTLQFDNKRRDRSQVTDGSIAENGESNSEWSPLNDDTDKENLHFRYVL
ncbi:uncharacterized protein Z518_05678 [Rhinocladiella mackenziei CBS 650.93]|uniref:Major facilitator superfamily (MFS) profile domain-containing protein n=1 Tax=Rhinocladiella mackenziei CBS 650.93 TaxID=1442369 RepID=A0A0D2FRK6_9EURO|nr:uncharacterized protein Z518_05678 [Rhinocladiella mackenziei CBS 650.93]KIX04807.1 hypothetical protein Z518_05678 [Rhinocladiella mackenziei CBS 650.93]